MIADEQLSYRSHIAFYEGLGSLSRDSGRDRYWHQQAEYLHVLSVCDAIRNLHIDAVVLAQEIVEREGDFQLRFGVARRAKFIWLSLRGVISQVHPERTEPLLHDDAEQVARDLNVIYLNIRGLLDNLAWLALAIFGKECAPTLPRSHVGLFHNRFLAIPAMADVARIVRGFTRWNRELSARRDPAAHRIPLSVPPAFLDEESKEDYEHVSAEYGAAFNTLGSVLGIEELQARKAKVDALHERLQRIGKFVPVFVHHPEEGTVRIYPTVPEDIGELVRISRSLFSLIRSKHREPV